VGHELGEQHDHHRVVELRAGELTVAAILDGAGNPIEDGAGNPIYDGAGAPAASGGAPQPLISPSRAAIQAASW
jgi:hypothetical protein